MPRDYLQSTSELCHHILESIETQDAQSRYIVAIVGAPGSGKSTLAESLVCQLNTQSTSDVDLAVVVPMDGFHLDNAVLDSLQLRRVKGSPSTFDVQGLLCLVNRLRHRQPQTIYVPVFDRSLDIAKNAAQSVEHHHSIIILEGNYLLLDKPMWRDFSAIINFSVMLDVPLETIQQRLVDRWLTYGFSVSDAKDKAFSNDIPNAKLVLGESMDPSVYYKSL